jgi:hypothetical protein
MIINGADTAWLLISAAMVMLMTPALALFYGGMVRRKNLLSTMMMSFVIIALVGLLWVLYGYSLAFGTDHGGIIGGFNFLGLNGVGQVPSSTYATTVPHLAYMIYQAMFAVITVALITGAVVERIKFSALLVFSVAWFTLVYVPVAHWVWGAGGWLMKLGVLDFAGGTVVHITAGVSALSLASLLGPRKGFHQKEPMEPNNIPLVALGAGILWFYQYSSSSGSFYLDDTQLDVQKAQRIGSCHGCGSRAGGDHTRGWFRFTNRRHTDRSRGGSSFLLHHAVQGKKNECRRISRCLGMSWRRWHFWRPGHRSFRHRYCQLGGSKRSVLWKSNAIS